MTAIGWPAADRAYQQHHAACPHCRAAGTSPNTQQRCPEGAQLWATYQQAGDPPHFTWLRQGAEGVKKWPGQHLVLDSELKFAPARLNACHWA